MQPVKTHVSRYDGTTILLHWATVALVAEQWVGAQVIDLFPRGPLRVDARSVHISLGLLLAILLVGRILWRLTRGRRLPQDGGAVAVRLAKIMHGGLYVLLLVMTVVGIALTWVRGDNIFNLFSIPSFAPGNRVLADQVLEIHGSIGSLILMLVALHAAAALVHHYVWRDGVLARMSLHAPQNLDTD